jgi:hypothetical protein
MNNFIGKDGFYWWVGVVENNSGDPLELGRCKVRIFGWHTENLEELPTEDLPWASILMSPSSTISATSIREGDYVVGFFQDGLSAQAPVIFGVYNGIETAEPDLSKGFSPQSKRPTESSVSETKEVPVMPEDQIDRKIGEPNTPRLYRGVVANTAIYRSNSNLSHVCGFKFNLNVNVDLGLGTITAVRRLSTALQRGVRDGKKGFANVVRAQMAKIVSALRKGLDAIVKAVGIADITGVVSISFSAVKDIVSQLNSLLSQAADMLYNVGLALGVVQGIQEFINWIGTLPQDIKNIFMNCLSNFTRSVQNLTNDINALPKQLETSIGSQFNSFTDSLNSSINTIRRESTSASSSQSQTMTNLINGDSSTKTLNDLNTMLKPKSNQEILSEATQSSLQRP